MTARDALKQNLGKWCKIVMSDGYILFNARAAENLIGLPLKHLDDEVLKVEKGRSAAYSRAEVIILIK